MTSLQRLALAAFAATALYPALAFATGGGEGGEGSGGDSTLVVVALIGLVAGASRRPSS